MSLKKAKKKVPVPSEDGSDSDGGVSLFAPSIRKAAKKASAASVTSSFTTDSARVVADASLPAEARVRWNPSEFAPVPGVPATFASLGIAPWQISVLASMAITKPTEIQQRCIPAILAGKDVVGRAKTGSGKTAAFALPILHTLAQDPYGICGLVLTPTRELAFQIADQFRALGAPMDIQVSVVIGGLRTCLSSFKPFILALFLYFLSLHNQPHYSSTHLPSSMFACHISSLFSSFNRDLPPVR